MNRKEVILLSIGFSICIGLALAVFILSEDGGETVNDSKPNQEIVEDSKAENNQSSGLYLGSLKPMCLMPAKGPIVESMKTLVFDKKMKYALYQKVFRKNKVSDGELLARLVYAETLAARCSQKVMDELMQSIYWTIRNRIVKKAGSVKAVVWQFNQFASALHSYKGSFIDAFLCPREGDAWSKSVNLVRKYWPIDSQSEESPFPQSTYNYFLFQHQTKPVQFSKNHWTQTFKVIKEINDGGSVCARFYENRFYR